MKIDYWMLDVVVVLCLVTSCVDSLAVCPQQCLCSDNNIVCSCESTTSKELKISSLGGSFIKSLTIHSCSKVTVTNGSFAGVVVSDRLLFVGIERLVLEPFAFRGIRQSPKQLVIEQCQLPVLLPNSFTGLSTMEHLWIRKSTIYSISTHAFQFLSNVNYLYLRETIIHHLQRHAFGSLRNVKNIYIRGSVQIDDSEGELFTDSSIEELVFHDVTGQLNEAFLLGTVAQKTSITDSSIKLVRRGDEFDVFENPAISTLTINNCTFNAFPALLFAHFSSITIRKSRIGKLRSSDVYSPHNYLSMVVEDSFIETIEAFAISHAVVRQLTFVRTRVVVVNGAAFLGSDIIQLAIIESRLKMLQMTSFAEANIEQMLISKSVIDRLVSKSFERAIIGRLSIEETTLSDMEDGVFYSAIIHEMEMNASVVVSSGGSAFEKTEIESASIRNCEFEGTELRNFFKQLQPVNLLLANSTFECEPDDCEFNAMLLTTSRHPLLWRINGNACKQDMNGTYSKKICKEATREEYDGLNCRRSWMISDCECTKPMVVLPSISNAIVIVGDCEDLTVNYTDGSTNRLLYLYRIARANILKTASNLRVLSVLHSNVNLRYGAFHPGRLSSLSFRNSNIESISDGSIAHLVIDTWLLFKSYLTTFPEAGLEGSIIHSLIINDTRVEKPETLFRLSNHVHMQNSLLFTADGLTSIKSAQFANNTILCCCESEVCPRTSPLECSKQFPHGQCIDYRTISTSPTLLLTFRLLLWLLLTVF